MTFRILITVVLLFLACGVNAQTLNDKIAYLAYVKNYWQVWVMSPDGDHKQQITYSKYDKSHLSWYPDGEHLLINDLSGNVYKLNIRTKQESEIELSIKGTLDAMVSPDGQYIAFSLSVADSIDNNHIWIVDKDGSGLKKITNMGGLQHEPVWSTDQKWLYFLSGRGGQSHDIWRVSLKDRHKEQMTIDQLYNFDIAFNLQGGFAYSSNRSGNYEIWVNQGPGKDTQITSHKEMDSRPTWSNDGETIIFESSRKGVMNIYKKRLEGKQVIQLTREKVGARYPVWWHEVKESGTQ